MVSISHNLTLFLGFINLDLLSLQILKLVQELGYSLVRPVKGVVFIFDERVDRIVKKLVNFSIII
jgi:hypothetical protein